MSAIRLNADNACSQTFLKADISTKYKIIHVICISHCCSHYIQIETTGVGAEWVWTRAKHAQTFFSDTLYKELILYVITQMSNLVSNLQVISQGHTLLQCTNDMQCALEWLPSTMSIPSRDCECTSLAGCSCCQVYSMLEVLNLQPPGWTYCCCLLAQGCDMHLVLG